MLLIGGAALAAFLLGGGGDDAIYAEDFDDGETALATGQEGWGGVSVKDGHLVFRMTGTRDSAYDGSAHCTNGVVDYHDALAGAQPAAPTVAPQRQ